MQPLTKIKRLRTQISRESSYELLRILAMLMIIAFHIMSRAVNDQLAQTDRLAFTDAVIYRKLALVVVVFPFGHIGNDLFLLISGYFLAGREQINIGRTASKLLSQLAFASILLLLVPIAIINQEIGYHYMLFTAEAFHTLSWFVGYYFAVILIAAVVLNRVLGRWERREQLAFILVLFALVSFSYSRELMRAISNDLPQLVMGVCLYAMGGYIRKYNPFGQLRTWVPVLTVVLAYVLVLISQWNATTFRIEEYLRSGSQEVFQHTFLAYDTYYALVVLIAVAMFELFRRIPSFHVRVINYLSSASFMVYLLHDNELFYKMWRQTYWVSLLDEHPAEFVLRLLGWTLLVYVIGTVAYTGYVGVRSIIRKLGFLVKRGNV